MALTMESDIRFVRGVGEERMKRYHKLGIFTVGDLLCHVPRSYLDLRRPCSILEAPLGQTTAVRAIVARKGGEQRLRAGLSVFKVEAVDQSHSITLTFFNGKYAVMNLHEGEEYIFYGKVEGTLLRKGMNTPAVYPGAADGLAPVYPLTAGLSSRGIAKDVATALAALGELPDPLPQKLRQKYGLCTLDYAIRIIHAPTGPEEAATAKNRLIFDELLSLSLSFARMKSGRVQERTQPMAPVELAPFYAALPFAPTGAQRRAIEEATRDLCTNIPMNRLVQGDVGSGKTLVAAACCWFAWKNHRQSSLMAPTEILAEQHYRSLAPLLEGLGMRLGLLTGSCTAKEKRLLKAALAAGELDLCIGTHALLTGDTAFGDLGLVVTDEQHRFGVAQRMSLSEKGRSTNVLVMSATPIPRTLGLIIYGDLELSVIDQLPPGRQKIDTFLIGSDKRQRAFGYIRKHLDRGLQAYIVCPLVEEDEEGEAGAGMKAAVSYLEELRAGPFQNYRLGLLHGRMKPAEKERTMEAFARGELQLLVATTVVEVGVDVPNAVIMMVENAERFGLSQLHQLRGRVGRGAEKSYCILLSDAKGENARERLGLMARTSDGFKIAEYDLHTRGPGDFFGMRQHGLPQMQIADLAADSQVLYQAQEAAAALLAWDPTLGRLPLLARKVERMTGLVAAGL